MNLANQSVPKRYICPISLDIMSDPLVSRSGHRFERGAIEEWIGRTGTNPITRETMTLRDLFPDVTLREEIRFWRKSTNGMENTTTTHSDEIGTWPCYDHTTYQRRFHFIPRMEEKSISKQSKVSSLRTNSDGGINAQRRLFGFFSPAR